MAGDRSNPNWTSGGVGDLNGIVYPIISRSSIENFPVMVQFLAVEYSARAGGLRSKWLAPGGKHEMGTVTLPLPRSLMNAASISYAPGPTETGGLLDPTSGEFVEDVITGSGVGSVAGTVSGAGIGAAIGVWFGGVVVMDACA